MKNLLNRLLKHSDNEKVLTGDLIRPTGKKSFIPPKTDFNEVFENAYYSNQTRFYKERSN